ncbi:MAG: hypothetical protein M3112_01685 [Actinomycetia bacterium]|nr:hypothetical protein [Actinomycetes bacterium]
MTCFPSETPLHQCHYPAGLIEVIGEENIHLEIDDGVTAFLNRAPLAISRVSLFLGG